MGCVGFQLVPLCVSIRLECFCFSEFTISILVFGSCWHASLFICRSISDISSSEKQHFFIIVDTRSASLWLVVRNLVHSSQVSSIIFIPSLCGIASICSKVQTCLRSPFFLLVFLIWVVVYCVLFVPEKRTANNHRMSIGCKIYWATKRKSKWKGTYMRKRIKVSKVIEREWERERERERGYKGERSLKVHRGSVSLGQDSSGRPG